MEGTSSSGWKYAVSNKSRAWKVRVRLLRYLGLGWTLIVLARSERFELPALGIEIRCSIQLSYERVLGLDYQT